MIKTGFDLIDKAFQEDLGKARQVEIAKLRQEIEAGKNPKFSQSHTDWMLAKYPYANKDQSDRAVAAEAEERKRQQETFDNEVEKRLGEKQAVLEQLHFGKHGRQFALEQAEREEKIQAFKQRQREKREQAQDKSAQVNMQTGTNNQEDKDQQSGDPAPETRRPHHLKDDFNTGSSEAEYDEWQSRALKSKEEAFKQRLREGFNIRGKEKSADLEPEM